MDDHEPEGAALLLLCAMTAPPDRPHYFLLCLVAGASSDVFHTVTLAVLALSSIVLVLPNVIGVIDIIPSSKPLRQQKAFSAAVAGRILTSAASIFKSMSTPYLSSSSASSSPLNSAPTVPSCGTSWSPPPSSSTTSLKSSSSASSPSCASSSSESKSASSSSESKSAASSSKSKSAASSKGRRSFHSEESVPSFSQKLTSSSPGVKTSSSNPNPRSSPPLSKVSSSFNKSSSLPDSSAASSVKQVSETPENRSLDVGNKEIGPETDNVEELGDAEIAEDTSMIEEWKSPDWDLPELAIPLDVDAGSFVLSRAEIAKDCWTHFDPRESIRVRGRNYLNDGIKIFASSPIGSCAGVQFLDPGGVRPFRVAKHPRSLVSKARITGDRAFYLVVSFTLPNPPYKVLVSYLRISKEDLQKAPHGFQKLWNDFIDGTDVFRASRLKLIPKVFQGPWYVTAAVPDKPALLGKKLDLSFERGEGYLEVTCDISTSLLARNVVALVEDYAECLVVDLAFTIEGQSEAELPERILGCFRLCRLSISSSIPTYL